jgi:hypothetical protein
MERTLLVAASALLMVLHVHTGGVGQLRLSGDRR